MHIDITNESNVTRVSLLSEKINWITFGDDLRIEITREQLESLVTQYEITKARKEIYEAVGIN